MPAWLDWVLIAAGGWLVTGTIFAFAVARAMSVSAGSVVAQLEAEPTGVSRRADMRRRALLVDDEAPLRSLLRATLPADDFDVREAGSAEEAAEVIRFWRPELVLLDVNLPGLDGLSFCSDLVRRGSDAAVILLTGEQVSETTARLAGAKAVVRKPFSPLELLRLVDRVSEQREFVSGPATAEDGQLLMYARDLASIARAERQHRQLL